MAKSFIAFKLVVNLERLTFAKILIYFFKMQAFLLFFSLGLVPLF